MRCFPKPDKDLSLSLRTIKVSQKFLLQLSKKWKTVLVLSMNDLFSTPV